MSTSSNPNVAAGRSEYLTEFRHRYLQSSAALNRDHMYGHRRLDAWLSGR